MPIQMVSGALGLGFGGFWVALPCPAPPRCAYLLPSPALCLFSARCEAQVYIGLSGLLPVLPAGGPSP